MRISDWSSDVCSSDLEEPLALMQANERLHQLIVSVGSSATAERMLEQLQLPKVRTLFFRVMSPVIWRASRDDHLAILTAIIDGDEDRAEHAMRLEEHTSELQSLMRISYAGFCV